MPFLKNFPFLWKDFQSAYAFKVFVLSLLFHKCLIFFADYKLHNDCDQIPKLFFSQMI